MSRAYLFDATRVSLTHEDPRLHEAWGRGCEAGIVGILPPENPYPVHPIMACERIYWELGRKIGRLMALYAQVELGIVAH